jgi:hypothetical protein
MRALLAFLPLILACSPSLLAGLAIVNPVIHEYEDGPIVGSRYAFRGGETVHLSFQISGYKATEEPDLVHLTYQISAADPSGRPLGPSKEGKIDAELAPEDKRWTPKVRYSLTLPAIPEPGRSVLKITVDDKVANTTAALEIPIQVESQVIEPSSGLTLRNFRFLRGESDSQPLLPGSPYHPGDTVWARFEVTGYAFGPQNHYEVRYGVSLLDDKGKILFTEPNAAAEKDESFYPKAFVPGVLNLRLDKTIRSGEYTLLIRLTDAVANQTYDSPHTFRVEK